MLDPSNQMIDLLRKLHPFRVELLLRLDTLLCQAVVFAWRPFRGFPQRYLEIPLIAQAAQDGINRPLRDGNFTADRLCQLVSVFFALAQQG